MANIKAVPGFALNRHSFSYGAFGKRFQIMDFGSEMSHWGVGMVSQEARKFPSGGLFAFRIHWQPQFRGNSCWQWEEIFQFKGQGPVSTISEARTPISSMTVQRWSHWLWKAQRRGSHGFFYWCLEHFQEVWLQGSHLTMAPCGVTWLSLNLTGMQSAASDLLQANQMLSHFCFRW